MTELTSGLRKQRRKTKGNGPSVVDARHLSGTVSKVPTLSPQGIAVSTSIALLSSISCAVSVRARLGKRSALFSGVEETKCVVMAGVCSVNNPSSLRPVCARHQSASYLESEPECRAG